MKEAAEADEKASPDNFKKEEKEVKDSGNNSETKKEKKEIPDFSGTWRSISGENVLEFLLEVGFPAKHAKTASEKQITQIIKHNLETKDLTIDTGGHVSTYKVGGCAELLGNIMLWQKISQHSWGLSSQSWGLDERNPKTIKTTRQLIEGKMKVSTCHLESNTEAVRWYERV